MKKKQEPYIHYISVEWDEWNDKAIRFNMLVYFRTGAPVLKRLFAPKSLLKDNALPLWFLEKKYKEQIKPDMRGWKVKGDLKTTKPERVQWEI
jgi:hypothetical protein